jgi:hypothetical protein
VTNVDSLEFVHDQEDVVDTDGQHQEWNDLSNDQRSLDASRSEQANTCRDGHEYNQDSHNT